MDLRLPWQTDPPPDPAATPSANPVAQAGQTLKPRGRRPAMRGAARAAASPSWRYYHLIVSGPAAALTGFAAAARGAGVTPWRLDLDLIEDDVFTMAVAPPAAERTLSIAGCRILARQFRAAVAARQARVFGVVGQSQACAFDLHALLPVPDAILALGPTHPDALAWLAAHWGVSDRPRQVALLPRPRPGRRLPKGHAVIGYGFFTAGETPAAAVALLSERWPALRFVLRPRPLG